MLQIVLDTETTGLNPNFDHIIEVGMVKLVDRRVGETFHRYIKPPVTIDSDAVDIHGLTDEFLKDKPTFREIEQALLEFLQGADEVLIHNAAFDVRFLNKELSPPHKIDVMYRVTDTLKLARQKRPGQRANLDALAKHYEVPGRAGGEHGALVDAKILAGVYVAMTSGQGTMELSATPLATAGLLATALRMERKVFLATPEEAAAHAAFCAQHKIPVF